MSTARDEDREQDGPAGPVIPGAWAQPASSFADETTVVRPERKGDGRKGGRTARLLALVGISLGLAAFAWGVTVSLQQLEDEDGATEAPAELASVTPAVALPPPPAPKPVDEAEREPAVPEGAGDDAAEPEEVVAVPRADPSFPSMPDPAAARADDVAAPERVRTASARTGADDVKDPTGKRKRQAKALAAAATLARKKQPATTTTATADDDDAAKPKKSPSAVALTREAEKLFSIGKLPAARGLAQRAVVEDGRYPRAHRTLAVICAKQGDGACARKGYETYLKLAPDAADAPDVRRILGM